MSKKLIAGCSALAAFAAFVLPAAASASPVLTQPTGTKMPAGTIIQATTVEIKLKFTSPEGLTVTECDTGVMTGSVFENTGTKIQIMVTRFDIHNAGGASCSSSFGGSTTYTTNVGNGTPWCVMSTKEDNFEFRGGACDEASRSMTFVLDTSTAGVCKYNSTTFPTGTFTTDTTGDAILRLAGAGRWKLEEGGFLCASEEKLDMNLTIETDPTSGTASPIYIS